MQDALSLKTSPKDTADTSTGYKAESNQNIINENKESPIQLGNYNQEPKEEDNRPRLNSLNNIVRDTRLG